MVKDFMCEPKWTAKSLLKNRSNDEIKNEPMLFSCDVDAAIDLGGPLTKEFVEKLLAEYGEGPWIFDSRVHMLMPGWYPCIPGWHHDDVPRNGYNGQPDYENMNYKSEHVMAIVDNGTWSLTEFVKDFVCDLSDVGHGEMTYGKWSRDIQRMNPRKVTVPNQTLVYFTWEDFHRGQPATGSGWRWFIRASKNTDRKPMNEVRKQVQVYMSNLDAGW